MSLQRISPADLVVDDEQSFETLAEYRALKSALLRSECPFLVTSEADGEQSSRLLNLAYWDPAEFLEVLPEAALSADQFAHNALHYCGHRALGAAACSVEGILFVESIASAADIYWLGRLLTEDPYAGFLESQVPAMSEAAESAGVAADEFAGLLQAAAADPSAAFGALRRTLFDTAIALVNATSVDEADEVLRAEAEQPWSALRHHYALSNWVLFARINGDKGAENDAVRSADKRLRESEDPMTDLASMWFPEAE